MSCFNFSKFFLGLSFLILGSCTPKGSGILNSNSSFSEVIDKTTKEAPFAFDLAVDTISYNSCTNYQKAGSGGSIPGFKIGVSEGFVDSTGNGAVKAGLKLRTDFLQYAGRNLKPQFPSTIISAEQVQTLLSNSPENKNSYIQFAVRTKKDLRIVNDLINPTQPTDFTAIGGRDAAVVFNEITSGYGANLLTKDIRFAAGGGVLSEGQRVYNLSQSADASVMEGSFQFNNTEDSTLPATNPSNGTGTTNKELQFGLGEFTAERARRGFNGNLNGINDRYVLTALFAGKAPEAAPGAPGTPTSTEPTIQDVKRPPSSGNTATDLSRAYGRSFQLNFVGKTQNVAGWTKNILNSVTEFDLTTGAQVAGAIWSCENFVIVRSDHYDSKILDGPTCSPLISTDLTTTRQLQIKKIRRHYSSADWNIGLFIPANTTLSASSVARRNNDRAQFNLCLSPRNASCYLPTSGFLDDPILIAKDIGIQYDTTKECYLTRYQDHGYNYSNVTTEDTKRLLGRCAQYASICTRTSTNF